MNFGLRTKLTPSFAVTALICVLLIGVFSNIQTDGQWDASAMRDLGIYAMEQGLILIQAFIDCARLHHIESTS